MPVQSGVASCISTVKGCQTGCVCKVYLGAGICHGGYDYPISYNGPRILEERIQKVFNSARRIEIILLSKRIF